MHNNPQLNADLKAHKEELEEDREEQRKEQQTTNMKLRSHGNITEDEARGLQNNPRRRTAQHRNPRRDPELETTAKTLEEEHDRSTPNNHQRPLFHPENLPMG